MIPARDALGAMLDGVKLADVKIADGIAGDAGAVFSPCEGFRYLLWRVWNPARPFWSFGMLNPSTADHLQLDPTVTRCQTRATAGGAGVHRDRASPPSPLSVPKPSAPAVEVLG
jgi:hypothetical protein